MKVFISSQYGKEKLVKAFEEAGATVAGRFDGLTDDVKLIIPTVDEELPFFASARDWFRSKGIQVLVSPESTIFLCRDKAEFHRFCMRHSFNTPYTMQGEFVVKPRFGKGSKGQTIVDRAYIVQEKITAPEYSIDYVADFERNTQSVIARKRLNVVNGESTAAEIVDEPKLIREATRLGQELKICGPAVMQCFYDGSAIKWIEVNPRFGGGSWLTFDRFHTPRYLVELLGKSNAQVSAMPEMSPSQRKDKDS